MKSTAKSKDSGAGLSRRGFLGLCAGAGAGAAAGLHSFRAVADVVPHKPDTWKKGEVITSTCGMCVNRCGIQCRVSNGVLEKIDGDPRNPKSRGGTCAKGQAGVMTLYDPDRIKYPMIRVGERGEGKWRRASWEEAYAYVAEQMTKIIDAHGPKSFMWSSSTDLTEVFFTRLGTYLGTQNFARHAALCLASRNVGYFGTMGGVPESDLARARYILIFGANRLESFELPYNIDLLEGIKNGAKLVVVDPRMTVTAAKGQWVAIRPRTDMALSLALMHVLINEELYDKDFVAQRTEGFDALKEHVQRYTPEWAERETGVSADAIRTMAREMAAAAPRVVVFPGRRTSWYTNDTQFRRTCGMLNGLLGAFDVPGSNHFSAAKAKLGSFSWEIEPFDIAPRFDGFDEEHFPLAVHDDGGYIHMRDAILNGTATYPVKGWMVYHQNPLAAVCDSNKTLKMMEQMDFICVIDIQPSQTAWMADVILPECTYLERLDPAWAPGSSRGFVMARQPVVQPMHESKTILEIIQGLARELDRRHEFDPKLADAFNFTMEDYLDAQLKPLGVDRASFLQEGIWLEPEAPLEFGAYRNGAKKFNTPSGKIEFVSERFRRNGYPALPEYEPVRDERGKLRLVTGHMAQFTHSANQNNVWLNALYPENEAWIHPAVAREKGIRNGEYIRVRSEAGEVRIKALVTPRIRPDTTFIVHGFGSASTGQTTVKGRGGADQVVIASRQDEISGNQAMHETRVEIAPA